MSFGKAPEWLRIAIVPTLVLLTVIAVFLTAILVSEKHPLVDRVTVSLAIAAILLAVIQYFHSKHILDGIQTRFLGNFPTCVGGVADVIASAKSSLYIMNDRCAYGQFSNRQDFELYFANILKKSSKNNFTVRMIIYDRQTQQADRDNQFKAEWEEIKTSVNFRRFYQGRTAPTTFLDFKEDLAQRETDYQKKLLAKGVDLRIISQEIFIFAWIADEKMAAFSFRVKELGTEREFAFRTSDPNLVKTLSGLFQRTWDHRSQSVTSGHS